jgi:hypothetical protein
MAPVRGDGMRGLAVFISDIRNCKYAVDYICHSLAHVCTAAAELPEIHIEFN